MDYFSGKLGDDGGTEVEAAELRFTGRLGAPFVRFALARGRRLSLTGWVRDEDDTVVIALQGPAALIDAFEITCSLGPIDARIDSWTRTDGVPAASPSDTGPTF
jgi:acylphosphatase